MNHRIDMHMHTVFSDGTDDHDTILNKAVKSGLFVMSVTDHDSIKFYSDIYCKRSGIRSPTDIFKDKGIKLVPGVEITVLENYETNGKIIPMDIEVLCYNYDFDLMDKFLTKSNKMLRENQIDCFNYYVKVCREAGITEAEKWVLPDNTFAGSVVRKGLLCAAKTKKDLVSKVVYLDKLEGAASFFREDVSVEGRPLYYRSKKPRLELNKLTKANLGKNAILSVAHFGAYSSAGSVIDFAMQMAKKYTNLHFEIGHPVNNETLQLGLVAKLLKLKREVLLTGGSDHHGIPRPGISGMVGEYPAHHKKINNIF